MAIRVFYQRDHRRLNNGPGSGALTPSMIFLIGDKKNRNYVPADFF
jgi:hypothetical protein